jgi:hypothetical protein
VCVMKGGQLLPLGGCEEQVDVGLRSAELFVFVLSLPTPSQS